MAGTPDSGWLDWYHRTAGRISSWLAAAGIQQLTAVGEAQAARARGVADAGKEQSDAYADMVRRMNSLWATSISSLTSMVSHDFGNAITKMAGTQGGLGQTGTQIGALFGKSAGKSVGLWLGGKDGEKAGAVIGRVAGRSMVSVLQTAEAIRVIGARFAPMVAGGMTGRTDYFNMGANVVAKTAELQMITGAGRDSILEYGTYLARLGLGFGSVGAEAAKMALASEKVLALSPGDVIMLLDAAVAQHGQRWDSVGKIIEEVATASEQWRRVAGATNSSVAGALAANQTLLNIYKGVAERVRGTSVDLTGLAKVTVALTNTMGKMGGMRPGQIAGLTTEVAKLLVPQVDSIVGMYTQSYFLMDVLGRSAPGRAQVSELQALATGKGYDPSAISMPLMLQLANNSAATEATFRNIIEGVGSTRDSMAAGDLATKNILVQQKMQVQFGVSPLFGRAMISMYDEYHDLLGKGLTPEDAWRRAGAAPAVQRELATVGPGVTIENIIQQSAQMGMAGLSVEQKLSLGVQSLANFGDWGRLKTEGKALYEAAAERILAGVSPRAAAAAMMQNATPLRAADDQTPVEGAVELTDPDDLQKALRSFQANRTTVGSTVKSTALGIEQTTTSTYDPYFNQYGAELGVDPAFLKKQVETESTNRPMAVSHKGAQGLGQIMPGTWRMLAPRIRARFPGEHISPLKPKHNLYGQALYMSDLLKRSGGDYQRAASMYNAGPAGNLNNPETREYRKKIFGRNAASRMATTK